MNLDTAPKVQLSNLMRTWRNYDKASPIHGDAVDFALPSYRLVDMMLVRRECQT